jgi:glutathione S-transferase
LRHGGVRVDLRAKDQHKPESLTINPKGHTPTLLPGPAAVQAE